MFQNAVYELLSDLYSYVKAFYGENLRLKCSRLFRIKGLWAVCGGFEQVK